MAQEKKTTAELTQAQLEEDFYLGGYQSCINKAIAMPKSREATFYLCLSYYHMGKFDNIRAHTESQSSDMICINLINKLVDYTQNKNRRPSLVDELRSMLDSRQVDADDDLSRLVISSIFVKEQLYSDALKTLDGLGSLPVMLARVSIYYLMNRGDLADKEKSKMEKINKYNTLTLLAAVLKDYGNNWPSPNMDKIQELQEIYRPTPLIRNLQTAAALKDGSYDLAKEYCQHVLELDNDNAEALINMQHILSKTKAPAQVKERYLSLLKNVHPEHEFVREFERIDNELVGK